MTLKNQVRQWIYNWDSFLVQNTPVLSSITYLSSCTVIHNTIILFLRKKCKPLKMLRLPSNLLIFLLKTCLQMPCLDHTILTSILLANIKLNAKLFYYFFFGTLWLNIEMEKKIIMTFKQMIQIHLWNFLLFFFLQKSTLIAYIDFRNLKLPFFQANQ